MSIGKTSLIIGFLLLGEFSYSQNLVLNPGFEDYYPGFLEDMDLDLYHNRSIDTLPAKFWYDFNDATPDYIHKGNVLQNHHSFQTMRRILPELYQENAFYKGEAAMGLCVLSMGGSMEHITGVLENTLKEDSIYELSFDIGLADFSYICSKRIGIFFTEDLPNELRKEHCYYDILFSDPIFANIELDISKTCCTNEMIEVKTLYEANGYERYFTIGIFYQESYDLNAVFEKYRWIDSKGKRYEERLLRKYTNTPIYKANLNYKPLAHSFSRQAYYIIDNVCIKPTW